jgi:polyvinyl alcohol dehydrogenase (cytochrome)
VPATAGPTGAVTRAWSAGLGAAVYGQPVAGAGRVFAATEGNRVAALDAATGRVLWTTSIGAPVGDVQATVGCGDIDPLGVTSTPALDPATGTLYVVGEVADGDGAAHHQLVGLDAATGAVRLSEPVDPPLPAGEQAITLLQRAGLAVANGRVYIGYGGNYGDCGHYHGWVIGVSEAGAPDAVSFEVAAGSEGGAVWQSGGAPAVDAAGDLYVSTGNANPDPPEGGPDTGAYTESVVKLSPTLQPLASFKDRVAGGDEDLSAGNPVLLPGGLVFSVGKTNVGYLLRQSDLAQVAAIRGVCTSDPDGGPAYDAATGKLYVPCRQGGIDVIDVATRTVTAMLQGANGAPLLVGPTLWALQYPAGSLAGWDASTGAAVATADVGGQVPVFASPSAAGGLLLVPTDQGVTALKAVG